MTSPCQRCSACTCPDDQEQQETFSDRRIALTCSSCSHSLWSICLSLGGAFNYISLVFGELTAWCDPTSLCNL